MLNRDLIQKVLTTALAYGGDFVELFFEDKSTNEIISEGGVIEKVRTGFELGVGIRVIYNGKVSYAYSEDLSKDALIETARNAGKLARGSEKKRTLINPTPKLIPNLHQVKIDPSLYQSEDKVRLVSRADLGARISDLIKQVKVILIDQKRKIMIANSDGLLIKDEQVSTRMTVKAVARRGELMQMGSITKGRTMGMEMFDLYDPAIIGQSAAEQALIMLNARPAPAGKMDVIINNGSGGVLFHEACGHSLESDVIVKGASVFTGKVGKKVASSIVTAIDGATLSNEWGSYSIDDEGTVAKRTVLIEDGILRDYMWDRVSATKAGHHLLTGNARRMSYRHLPIPRMTNTFIDRGKSKVEDFFKNVDRGLFVKEISGGQVNTSTGDFVFSVKEGYLIERGEVSEPVRGATLIGNGPKTLFKIEMIADDLAFHAGNCGKQGQGMQIGVGQPTLLISDMTVGGIKRQEIWRK
ncbi:MAG: TldD/PmbA family protein [Halanaerobiales bacterium]|nr:TldD/PmbA family protein [Halanaerobiales bacterium]